MRKFIHCLYDSIRKVIEEYWITLVPIIIIKFLVKVEWPHFALICFFFILWHFKIEFKELLQVFKKKLSEMTEFKINDMHGSFGSGPTLASIEDEKSGHIENVDVIEQLKTVDFLDINEKSEDIDKYRRNLNSNGIVYKNQLKNFVNHNMTNNITLSFYDIFHDRLPDPDGYSFWGSMIYQHQCNDRIIQHVANRAIKSEEYKRKGYTGESTSARLKAFEVTVKTMKRIFPDCAFMR